MPAQTILDGTTIRIDLQNLRNRAEGDDRLQQYADKARSLAENIRSRLSESPEIDSFEVQAIPSRSVTPVSKAAEQILDAIQVLLPPIGIVGFVKLIIDLIKVSRAQFPATFEIQDKEVGSIKITQEKISDDDIRKAEEILRKLRQKNATILIAAKNSDK